mmetsp:Transcript_4828/g.16161  ORF Transcript_4828/g.16161 Transcript_4828/m.16161 type:complete len:784 (+) Transcript_4828:47-2398(+)
MMEQPSRSKLPEDRPRRCTDCLFLLAFLGALGAAGYAAVYASKNGDLARVLYGQDYMADLCGQDNSIEATGLPEFIEPRDDELTLFEKLHPGARISSRPPSSRVRRGMRDHTSRSVLYFTLPAGELGGFAPVAVCLDECPGDHPDPDLHAIDRPGTWVCTGKYASGPPPECPDGGGDLPQCVAYRNAYFLRAGAAAAAACADPLQDCDVCFPPYPTTRVLQMCLPQQDATLAAMADVVAAVAVLGATVGTSGNPDYAASAYEGLEGGSGDGSTELSPQDMDELRRLISSLPHMAVEDLSVAWPVLAGCSAVALLVGFAWLLLIRFLAGLMVWITLFGLAAADGVLCWWLWTRQQAMKADVRYGEEGDFTSQADAAYISFFVFVSLGAIYVLLVLCFRKQIQLAARALAVAALAVGQLPALLILPLASASLAIGALCGGGMLLLLLASCGEIAYGRPGFGSLYLDSRTEYLLLVAIVVSIWIVVFVRHTQHAAVGGAVTKWYLHRNTDRSATRCCGGSAVALGLWHALRYHAGSIAAGSLLITTLKLIRIAFFLLKRTFYQRVSRGLDACGCNGSNRLAAMCLCCISCCLKCVEKSLEALSRYAYAQMMRSKRSFCPSAAEAVRLLTTNLAGAASLRFVAAAFLFLGKLLVAAGCAFLGWRILEQAPPYDSALYSPLAPAVCIFFAAFAVALVFFGVYNMALDTIFLCLCADKERVDAGMPPLGRAHELSSVLGVPIDAPAPQHPRGKGGRRMLETPAERSGSDPSNNPFSRGSGVVDDGGYRI